MPGLGELFSIAAKTAADKVFKDNALKKELATAAGHGIAEISDTLLQKLGIQTISETGEVIINPVVKYIEVKIRNTAKLHPERKKLYFHFSSTNSIKAGVSVYNLEGEREFDIYADKKNYKRLDLYKNGTLAGSIEEKFVLLRNPLSEPNKYEITQKNTRIGIVTVKEEKLYRTVAIPDFAEWKLRCIWGRGHILILDPSGHELGKFYMLGNQYYVMDYVQSLDPAMVLLTFMPIRMRREKDHIQYQRQKTLR